MLQNGGSSFPAREFGGVEVLEQEAAGPWRGGDVINQAAADGFGHHAQHADVLHWKSKAQDTPKSLLQGKNADHESITSSDFKKKKNRAGWK